MPEVSGPSAGPKKNGEPYAPRFLSITLQYTTATIVLASVATIAGPTTAAGFVLPY